MLEFAEIKKPLKKVLEAIHEDRSKFAKGLATMNPLKRRITAENLENSIGSHLLDDHPERFGITTDQGHMIRAYFQNHDYGKGNQVKDYIEKLHQEFPDLMEPENPAYLDSVNRLRKKRGEPLLDL